MAKAYPDRRAEAQRAHAALEGAATDAWRHARVADRLDHVLRELIRRFRSGYLRSGDIFLKSIRAVTHCLLNSEARH